MRRRLREQGRAPAKREATRLPRLRPQAQAEAGPLPVLPRLAGHAAGRVGAQALTGRPYGPIRCMYTWCSAGSAAAIRAARGRLSRRPGLTASATALLL